MISADPFKNWFRRAPVLRIMARVGFENWRGRAPLLFVARMRIDEPVAPTAEPQSGVKTASSMFVPRRASQLQPELRTVATTSARAMAVSPERSVVEA